MKVLMAPGLSRLLICVLILITYLCASATHSARAQTSDTKAGRRAGAHEVAEIGDSTGQTRSGRGKKADQAQRSSPRSDEEIPIKIEPSRGLKRVAVLIELTREPAVKTYAREMSASNRTFAASRQAAVAASRTQMSVIQRDQRSLAAVLAASNLNVTEIYRVQRVLNGIAVYVEEAKLEALRALPGVKAVHVIEPEFPLQQSVPFVGTPQLWNNSVGLGSNILGTGIKLGIIDTGIDYQHPDFGGTGQLADYQANPRTSIAPPSLFPTAKVVGGTDFAGDGYTGSNVPVPDNNPMDCNGHGSHVAGIAAGLGVNPDGTTYTGAYGPGTPFNTLKVPPGMAPGAKLYALRVFGCGGSTGLTVQAIDWAIDPNGDNDFSDHLDVINMSLGSKFGRPANTSAMASENAALAGVIVVAAAGNDGDTFFITGSPAVSGRTMSVAASVDTGVASAALTVTTPPAIAGAYAAAADAFGGGAPGPSGQTGGVVLVQSTTGVASQGCGATFSNAGAVSGKIALIDRGTCGFQQKVANAQANGAIGAIVANNVPGDPTLTTMGPTGGQPAVTVPALFISFNDGATIKAQLGGGVNATLGAATAADTLAFFSSRGVRVDSPHILKPDIAAPGLSILSAQSGITCVPGGGCLKPNATGFLAGGQSLTISGTSMATPAVAGVMSLLRQLHPDWSVEELKALAMNGAIHDITIGANGAPPRFGPGRVGAGRIDPVVSALLPVAAFNADDAGLVSVSFDAEVVGSATVTKNIRVVNKGTTDQTYTLGIDSAVTAPGVAFSFPGGTSIMVPAGKSVVFPLQMTATGSQMDHAIEASLAPVMAAPLPLTGLGSLSRHWLTEGSGYVTFSQAATLKLRVPFYSAARPESKMAGASQIATGGNTTGSTSIALAGTGVCSGTLGGGPSCTGTFPTNEVSLVSPFELQAVGTRNTSIPAYANIQYAGVAYDSTNNLLMFGVSTFGDWSTPTDFAFNILIDPTNTGSFTRVLFNSNPGSMALGLFGNPGATPQDAFITGVLNTLTSGVSTQQFVNRVSAAAVDSAVFKNRVMILAATPASLGLTGGNTSFRWKVQTTSGATPLAALAGTFDSVGPAGGFPWNLAAPNQGLNFAGASLLQDLNGASIPVTFSTPNITANGSLGALLLHHHNGADAAQVIPVEGSQSADLSIAESVAGPPVLGQNLTFTVTVTSAGPNTASNVVVEDLLPSGLTYISDDGGGAYSSGTGLWTVGSLAASASATLHIIATVSSTDPSVVTAKIVGTNPLDPNPANDQASVTVTPPREADLSVGVSATNPSVTPGADTSFNIVVTNQGNDPAYNIQVIVSFPSFGSLPIKSFIAGAGVFNPTTKTWNVASLGKGKSDTLTVTVTTPLVCGSLMNQANLSAETADPNNSNNTASASTTLTGTAPGITLNPISQALAGGGSVTFTAGASGVPAPTVQWQVSTDGGATWNNIPNATSTSLTFTPTPSQSGYQYRAVFSNVCGMATTTSASLTAFDKCLMDDSGKLILQLNSATGDYKFIACGGITLSGKGTLRTVGNIVQLTDNRPDRHITAGFNLGQQTGSAVITLINAPGIYQTFHINDTKTFGGGCTCAVD
jgi:uncharacterized repeat protein (TIGR01451 family)